MAQTPPCPSCGALLDPSDRFCGRCGATLPSTPAGPSDDGEADLSTEADALEARLREALSPHYLIVRRLGAGGMGRVYLAREPTLKRLVAVKVLAPRLAVTPTARARFQREAQAVAGLSHPNVISIYRVGELDDGTPYFVMQYAGGESLAARLKREGPADIAEGRRVLGQVASALAAAHAKGIIHRDIKPANVLYDDESGRVLVSDFGIAAVLPASEAEASAQLTHTGAVVGTQGYMSPEQQLGEKVTERTDVYSLGLLGYELLGGGSNEGAAASPRAVLAAHLGQRLSVLRPDVDPELEAVLAACLTRDWERRPGAVEVARRLGAVEGAVLEWPPPGIEHLSGLGWRLARDLGVGVGAVLATVLTMIAAGPALPAAASSVATLALVLAALAGVVILGVQVSRLLRAAVWCAGAVRAGYGWLTVAEVLADRRGDTGALVAGLREYAALEPPVRDRLRRARLRGVAAAALAAGLPLLGLALSAVLGGQGLLGPVSAFVLVLAPLAIALAAAAHAEHVERSVAGPLRRRLARHVRPASTGGRLVDPWYESFESARRGQVLGRGTRAKPWVSVSGAAVATSAIGGAVLLLLPLLLVGIAGPMFWQVVLPKLSNTVERVRIANIMRPYRLPFDTTISAIEGGRAYHSLMSIGRRSEARRVGEQPPARVLPQIGIDRVAPEGWNYPYDFKGLEDSLMARARRGVGPAARAFLERIAASPHFREVGIVARAPTLDHVAARFRLPFPDSIHWVDLPLPNFSATREVSYAAVLRAAALLARRQEREAEVVLRETVSFGLALMDEGTLLDALIGMVVTGIGRAGLVGFYGATGRGAQAGALRAARDSVEALNTGMSLVEARSSGGGSSGVVAQRRKLIEAVVDPTLLRAARWEFAYVLGLTPCTNVRELVFGPQGDVARALDRARGSLVRTPGEAALWDLMRASATRIPRSVFSETATTHRQMLWAARLAGTLLRNDRLAPCLGALVGLRGM